MPIQSGQITYRDVKQNSTTGIEFIPFKKKFLIILVDDKQRALGFETDADGKFSYDVPVGKYVGVFVQQLNFEGATPKNYSGGRILDIKSNSPAEALDDFLKTEAGATNDALLNSYKQLFEGMQQVQKEFRDEAKSDGTGLFVKQSSVKRNNLRDAGAYHTQTNPSNIDSWLAGDNGLLTNITANIPPDVRGLFSDSFMYVETQGIYSSNLRNRWQTVVGYRKPEVVIRQYTPGDNGGWTSALLLSSYNTRVGNYGQLHNGAGLPKELVAIEDSGVGTSALTRVNRSNFRRGIYYDSPNAMDDAAVSTNNIVIGGHTGSAGGAIYIDRYGNIRIYGRYSGVWSNATIPLSNKNTTVDSNGNYKPASPVVQLHHNRVEYNEDFDKDNPPEFEHLETGVYRITNVREICKDGWTYNKPLNGKSQPYFMIKYEQEDETTLLVRVFERTFNSKTGEFGFGEPRDIGVDERWIDFHFEIDHERIAREEAQMQKEQEEFEEQERLRKEAEDLAEAEAQRAWEEAIEKEIAEMEAQEQAQE